MSAVCPKDYKPCCDDLCHGSGCLRMNGYTMLEVCDVCHGIIDEEMPDCGTCTCAAATMIIDDPQPHHVADLLQRLRAWQDLEQPREALLPLSPGDVAVLIRTLHAYEAARRDAERYLAIRNDAVNPMRLFACKADDENMVGVESMLAGAELDAAIDAAIEGK